MAIRLSIPIFAEPQTRVNPHLKWHAEIAGRGAWLVAENDGSQHDTIRNITLSSPDGRKLHVDQNASPYVLAGATRRWRVPASELTPLIGRKVQLNAMGETAAIAESVPVLSAR